MKVKPLKESIGKLVDEFLDDVENYAKFVEIAEKLGFQSENAEAVKTRMFTIVDNEITFATKELEELFFEWQLMQQLKTLEPYASVIKKHPERKGKILDVALRAYHGEEITSDDMEEIFNNVTEKEVS